MSQGCCLLPSTADFAACWEAGAPHTQPSLHLLLSSGDKPLAGAVSISASFHTAGWMLGAHPAASLLVSVWEARGIGWGSSKAVPYQVKRTLSPGASLGKASTDSERRSCAKRPVGAHPEEIWSHGMAFSVSSYTPGLWTQAQGCPVFVVPCFLLLQAVLIGLQETNPRPW